MMIRSMLDRGSVDWIQLAIWDKKRRNEIPTKKTSVILYIISQFTEFSTVECRKQKAHLFGAVKHSAKVKDDLL